MKPDKFKTKLFRKVNTTARGVRHNFGGDFKHSRNAKSETKEQISGSMHGKQNRGLDYTPLFKFLLSKVGSDWNDVFSEAVSRLDKAEPIFWIVAKEYDLKEDYVRVGESTYFSGMYVDDLGKLQLTNPSLNITDLKPICSCCTHTFNGKVFSNKV